MVMHAPFYFDSYSPATMQAIEAMRNQPSEAQLIIVSNCCLLVPIYVHTCRHWRNMERDM